MADQAELQVIHSVDLKDEMDGMEPSLLSMNKYSNDSVAIAHGNGIVIISSTGNIKPYTNIPTGVKCYLAVFQQDRSVCIKTDPNTVHVYSSNGTLMEPPITMPDLINLSKSPSDEIIVTHNTKEVKIYNPTGTTLKHTFQSKHDAWLAPGTKSRVLPGLIVVSSCPARPNMMVTVHDRDGNAGQSLLPGMIGVYLYAAVDDQDRVYVASVQSGKVVIRLYDIDGLNLLERVKSSAIKLELNTLWRGVHFVSLSPGMLALASGTKLYFIKMIKVSH